MRIIRYAHGTVRYGVLEDSGNIKPLLGPPFEGLAVCETTVHVDDVTLLAPVEPRNIYCAGLNYVKHAEEQGRPLPKIPMFFMKPTSTIIGPGEPVVYPAQAQSVEFEGEVAVVIGKAARRVSEAEAPRYILGYTCGNDVSERLIQGAEMEQGCLLVGKGFDGFNPLGPAIETDLDPSDITILARVNGEERQNGNTSDLVFSIAEMVSYLSSATILLPGDVIMTGTPSGVGPIVPGDVVEVEIPGVGVLRNEIVHE